MSDRNWQRALYDLPTPAWLGIQDSYYSAVIPAQAGMMERSAQCDG